MYQGRTRLFSVGVSGVIAGLLIFLLVMPAVEREAHLADIETGAPEQWENALRQLCWIRSGRDGLDGLLPRLSLDRRQAVLAVAEELGCLAELDPALVATFYIQTPESEAMIDRALGQGAAAIEPALEALQSDDPDVRARGLHVLTGLVARMDARQRERTVALLETMQAREPGQERLLEALGAAVTDLASDEAAVDAAPPQIRDQVEDQAEDEALETAPSSPAGQPDALRLREPTLELPRGLVPGGVLFSGSRSKRASDAGPDDEEPSQPSDEGARAPATDPADGEAPADKAPTPDEDEPAEEETSDE